MAINYNDTPDAVTTYKKVLSVVLTSNLELDWRPPVQAVKILRVHDED